jgi:hypothetical protein
MHRLMLIVAFAGLASSAGAQVMPVNPVIDPVDFESKMTAAMAGANKPGDTGMGCDAIQRELVGMARDPAVQAAAARQGAAAQQQIARLNEASAAVSGAAAGTAAAQMAMGFASAFAPAMAGAMAVPGVTAAGPTQAQMRALQAQAAVSQQVVMTQMQEMVKIMPQVMRAQRLVELASTRKCEWAPVLTPPAR